MSVPQPWSARRIAVAAGTDPAETDRRLREFLAGDELLAFDQNGQLLYYPEPVTAYLEATGGPPEGAEEAVVTTIRNRLAEWHEGLSIHSIEGLLRYHHAARLVASSRLDRGLDVYDREWDVLVVLDTCRIDALQAVVDRLDADGEVTEQLSVGSQTAEWLAKSFTSDRDAVGRTGYVAGNGWAKGVFEDGLRPDDDIWFRDLAPPTTWNVVDANDLGALVHAWQRDRGEYSRDVPWEPHPDPEVVTDHAIALARERYAPEDGELNRLVVHYKQPHAPYTIAAQQEDRAELAEHERAPFEYLDAGGDRTDVWDAYLTDLAATVEDVADLCHNVDGTVAITADHGEAFGEAGEYGHRPAMLHQQVRRVPWVTVEASDEGTRDGDLSAYSEADRGVDEQLEALGYK